MTKIGLVLCCHHDTGCPPCIHSKPHEPDSVALRKDWPHLKEDTERVCSPGQCCTRPLIVECKEVSDASEA